MKKDRKRTVEDCLSIDSRTMARSNSLIDGAAGIWVWRNGKNDIIGSIGYLHQDGILTLQYAIDGQEIKQHIRGTSTPCNYGKHRYWFLCPNHGCNKRVAKLYLANGVFHTAGTAINSIIKFSNALRDMLQSSICNECE